MHEGAFKLILRNSKNATKNEVFDGGRWCEVLWRKDELLVAITDWGGSNCADILLLEPKKIGRARALQDIINMATMRATVSRQELQGHCYWEALNWQADGQLRFRIFGHTDTNPGWEFAHVFLVKLPEGVVTVVKSKGPNPHGGANGRKPLGSETNPTSAAAASRRSP